MTTYDAEDFAVRSISGPLFDQAPAERPFARSNTRPSPEEVLIASLIWEHRGRKSPVSIARLKELTGYSERQIKGIVEQLVVTHRMRIGGSREEPAGYFVIESAEDLDAAVGPYKSQILAMLRRLRVLDSAQARQEFLGQIRIELEG